MGEAHCLVSRILASVSGMWNLRSGHKDYGSFFLLHYFFDALKTQLFIGLFDLISSLANQKLLPGS